MMTPEHAQQILMGLLAQWLSPKEQRHWLDTARDLERKGFHATDAREPLVKKLLEVPARGREMALALIDEGATPQEYADFVATLFKWIDGHAQSVQEADATITRIGSGCDLEWHRVPGGYRIRPTFGRDLDSKTSVQIWDDEAERLTQEVSTRLGATALRDALANACNDVRRDGNVDVEALLEQHARTGLAMAALDEPWLRAYKARLRELLTTH